PAVTDKLLLDLYATALPNRTDAKAYLRYRDAAYTLLAGSKINPVATDSLPSNVRKLRDALLSDGGLVQRESYLELMRDIPFSKPSPASALVKGRSSTGYRDWLRKEDDRLLGDILSPAVQPSIGIELDL
ncbi:MAG: DUF4357 domain-containing protein, partial [Rhizobium sp.]|nr:DUF4357 domain-containing protein [Rhizobium sp.]